MWPILLFGSIFAGMTITTIYCVVEVVVMKRRDTRMQVAKDKRNEHMEVA